MVVVVLYHLPTSALRDLTGAQPIATRLGEDEIPVSDMVDLSAASKGPETVLLAHLDEAKGRVEQIERGEYVHQFRLVASAGIGEEPARQIPSFGDDFTSETPMPTTADDISF